MTAKPHHIITATGFFALAAAMHVITTGEEKIDSLPGLFAVSASLGDACISRKSPDIRNCATAMMSATLAVADTLESYLDERYPDNAAARVLAVDCSTSFRIIVAKYEFDAKIRGTKRAVPDYFRGALSESRRCLQAIENVSSERSLNYMPSVTSFLHRKINDAENGKIIIGWHI
ncbi:MAG TPA: hypothetical protein VFS88_00125 [Micavibrio sp.]|nr:hypothetical protein [Micavibrio sp.]